MSPIRNKYWNKPKYVKLYERRGVLYSYYRRGASNLPSIGNLELWIGSTAIRNITADLRDANKRLVLNRDRLPLRLWPTMKVTGFGFSRSPQKIRHDYALSRLGDKLDHLPLSSITRRSVVRLQAKIAEAQPRNAIEAVKALRLVFE